VKAFFDTNILVYAQQRGEKADRARALLSLGGMVSVQVLNELASVARKKLGMSWQEIAEAVADILALIDPPQTLALTTHLSALALARDHGVGFYDALIVAAAGEAGCDLLYSEDLQDGRAFGGLKIVNPFR
jgi:predicted nucleic acid-binding protein